MLSYFRIGKGEKMETIRIDGKEINILEVEQRIKEGNEIIDKIEMINRKLEEIQKQDYERERQLLGIALCDCKTVEEIEEYEKKLNANEDIINNDEILNALLREREKLLKEKWASIEQLHGVLCKLIENYKEIKPRWIWLKYKDIKKIFREHAKGMSKCSFPQECKS